MSINNKLLTAILLLTVTALYAQPRIDPEKQVERLTEDLNLSEEQQNNILEILEETQDQIDELLEDAGDDRFSIRDEMQEIIKNSNKMVEAELNDKQLVEYQKIMEDRKKNRGNRSNGRPRGNK